MLRGIYAPSDYDTHNEDPSMSASEKLAIIAASPVTVDVTVAGDQRYDDDVVVKLPYVYGGEVSFGLDEEGDAALLSDFSVGDDELYGNGIGTRLLQAGIRYALDTDPRITHVVGVWVRLGMLNTIAKSFGVDNVTVTKGGQTYGLGTPRAVEDVFDDFPLEEGKPYLVQTVKAVIDPQKVASWEQPLVRDDVLT